MKRSTRIKRTAIAVALVLAAPAAHAGLQGNGWMNGLNPNGVNTTNGLGGMNGFEYLNGFSGNGLGGTNGFSGNGLGSTNGLGSSNGLAGTNGLDRNGLGGINGFELANGINSTNGLAGSNGFELANGINSTNGLDRNGLARKAVSDQPAHKTGCEGIDRHVFCRSANPFSGLSIKPLGAPAHDAAVK
jgi:hypothetical protein